jgi:bile acid:Na+ symporter, BASS family
MDMKQAVILTLQVSILGTVFGYGLKMTADDFRYLFNRPGLLARSLLPVLVVMPIVAVLLVRTFDVKPALEIALIALALSPVPPLLPQRESKAGGHASYGLALMAVLATVGIATIPLSLEILQRVFGRTLDAAPAAVVRLVLMTVLLPLAGGMAVRALWPAAAERIEPRVGLAAKIVLALGALALLAGTWRAIWEATGGGAVITMVVFVAFGLLIGDLFGRPERDHSVVLALSSACRHPAIALTLASANMPTENFAGTILLYLLVNVVVGMLYFKWRQPARASVVAA